MTLRLFANLLPQGIRYWEVQFDPDVDSAFDSAARTLALAVVFRAVAGFADARHGNAAELKLTIEADGKVIAADVFKGKDKARGLTVDVKGVRQLRVAVDRDYPSETAAYLILADAKVQK